MRRRSLLSVSCKKKGGEKSPPVRALLSFETKSVAVAARSTAVSAAPTAAAAAAARLGTSFVHGQRAPAILLARKGRDGVLRLVIVAEFNESETLRAARVAIGDHGDGVDVPVLGEKGPKVVFGSVVGQVSDVQFHR